MPDQPTLLTFDIRDPEFPQRRALWALQMHSEMMEIVIRTEETMAASRELLVKFDRLPDPWRWKAPAATDI